MIFVNNIGDIVHSMTDRFLGAPNKNIGDAFLLVWTLNDALVNITQDYQITYLDQPYCQMMSDFAAIAFLKVIAKVHREPKILAYRNDTRLLARMKNYKVKMGMGMHIGWSIEGAIGSDYKIDASYLGPNAKLAERLEGQTKTYGMPVLFSEPLFNNFSPSMKSFMRHIDRVKLKAVEKPFSLYSIDIAMDTLPPSKECPYTRDQYLQINYLKKQFYQSCLDNRKEQQFEGGDLMQLNKDLKLMI